MTFEQEILHKLTGNGLTILQATEVIALAKKSASLSPMKDRWSQDKDYRSAHMRTILWSSVKEIAAKWLDENLPDTFLGRVFKTTLPRQSTPTTELEAVISEPITINITCTACEKDNFEKNTPDTFPGVCDGCKEYKENLASTYGADICPDCLKIKE